MTLQNVFLGLMIQLNTSPFVLAQHKTIIMKPFQCNFVWVFLLSKRVFSSLLITLNRNVLYTIISARWIISMASEAACETLLYDRVEITAPHLPYCLRHTLLGRYRHSLLTRNSLSSPILSLRVHHHCLPTVSPRHSTHSALLSDSTAHCTPAPGSSADDESSSMILMLGRIMEEKLWDSVVV